MSDTRVGTYLHDYFRAHPDNVALMPVVQFFLSFQQQHGCLESIFGELLRQALDEVIDMRRTRRFSIDELEKTEKTYIGTKVEILLRSYFSLEKGRLLDLLIAGIEVDVKNTVGSTWMIPREAINHICILLQPNDDQSAFNVGLIICRDRALTAGSNQDSKRSVSAAGKREILWLIYDGRLPKNFFLHIQSSQRESILSLRNDTERLAAMFMVFQGEVLARELVEAVASQSDYMKRLRRNGGARDILDREGFKLMWGGNLSDREKLEFLGYQGITKKHFVCLPISMLSN